MSLEAYQPNFMMMRELVELQSGKMVGKRKAMGSALKGSSSQQSEKQEKHHPPAHIPPKGVP